MSFQHGPTFWRLRKKKARSHSPGLWERPPRFPAVAVLCCGPNTDPSVPRWTAARRLRSVEQDHSVREASSALETAGQQKASVPSRQALHREGPGRGSATGTDLQRDLAGKPAEGDRGCPILVQWVDRRKGTLSHEFLQHLRVHGTLTTAFPFLPEALGPVFSFRGGGVGSRQPHKLRIRNVVWGRPPFLQILWNCCIQFSIPFFFFWL